MSAPLKRTKNREAVETSFDVQFQHFDFGGSISNFKWRCFSGPHDCSSRPVSIHLTDQAPQGLRVSFN